MADFKKLIAVVESLAKAAQEPKIEPIVRAYHAKIQKPYAGPIRTPSPTQNQFQGAANAYGKLKHDPQSHEVASAYGKLKQETLGHYQHLKDAGYKFRADPVGDQLPSYNDILNHKDLGVFTGSPPPAGHPLSEKLPFNDPLGSYNNVFRAVHDVFGHALATERNGGKELNFDHIGEDETFRDHSSLYSPQATSALATETRGQNTAFHFGPDGAHNRVLPLGHPDVKYPAQKAGLLPPDFWKVLGSQPIKKAQPSHPQNQVLADQLESTQGFQRGPSPHTNYFVSRIQAGGVDAAGKTTNAGQQSSILSTGYGDVKTTNRAEAKKMGFKQGMKGQGQYFNPKPHASLPGHDHSYDPEDVNAPEVPADPSLHWKGMDKPGWKPEDVQAEKDWWGDIVQSLPAIPKLVKAWPKDEAENQANIHAHNALSVEHDSMMERGAKLADESNTAFKTIGQKVKPIAADPQAKQRTQDAYADDQQRQDGDRWGQGISGPREPSTQWGHWQPTVTGWNQSGDGAHQTALNYDHKFWTAVQEHVDKMSGGLAKAWPTRTQNDHFSDHDSVHQDMIQSNHPKAQVQDVSADVSKLKPQHEHDVTVAGKPNEGPHARARSVAAWHSNMLQRAKLDLPGHVEPAHSGPWHQSATSGFEPTARVHDKMNAFRADREFWRAVGGSARRAALKKP